MSELTRERTERNKKKVLDALVESNGIVTDACKMVGVGRTQFYTWMKEDSDFSESVRDAQEQAIDYVEGQLFKNISEQDKASIIFYLKTKARHRGYVERVEQEITDNSRVSVTIENPYDPKGKE